MTISQRDGYFCSQFHIPSGRMYYVLCNYHPIRRSFGHQLSDNDNHLLSSVRLEIHLTSEQMSPLMNVTS